MKKFIYIIFGANLLFGTMDLFAKELPLFHSMADITVTGTVRDEKNNPLSFVTIGEKGTSNATYSDDDGRYSIVVKSNGVLVFSSVGYESVEIQVFNQSELNVQLISVVKQLEQVVVVGYGTSKKSDVTGSSAKIKGVDIQNTPFLTATQSIQGKAAGVQVINSGAPGSAPNVRIRGVGSILGGADPLYVVDGIITTDIRNINTADILAIDILKDASSTAIYGARAANGVVLITTKAGNKDRKTLQYNTQVGFRVLTNSVKMSLPGYYSQYSNEAADAPAVKGEDITGTASWYKEITRPALFQNHNVSLNGKYKNYGYYLSLGFVQENGILIDNNYRRFNIRYNHDISLFKKLKVGNTLAVSKYISNNKPFSLFTQSYIAAPIYNPVNPDGSFGNTSSVINNVGNPLATLKTTNDRSFGNRYQGTLWGEYELIKGLTFRTQFGIDLEQNNGWTYIPKYFTYLPNGIIGAQFNELPDLSFRNDTIYQWVWDQVLTYETKLDAVHNIKIQVGHTAERRDGWRNESTIANNLNIADNSSGWILNTSDTTNGQQNFRNPIDNYFRRESYFARLNYKLLDRYLVNATFRRDANSNFPASNRWGNFPSVGIGWIVSNEDFMKSFQRTIDELKLRVSYGLVGNDVIRPGQFDLRPTQRLYSYFGTDRIDGAIVTGIVDPNLRWEVVREFDLGIEYSILNGKFTGELDYYNKVAKDALYTIPYAAIGFGNEFLTNAATVKNSGLEFVIRWNHRFNKNMNQNLGLSMTYNTNEVTDVGLGRALNFGSLANGFTATQTLTGFPIGSFWVFRTNGIFQNEEEVKAYPHVIGTKPGDLRLVDKNSDGVIDNLDREHVGTYQPKFFFGLNYALTWKRFDFAMDVFGNFGNKVYNAKKGIRYGSNYNVELDIAKNHWVPGSGNNKIPRASNVTPYPSDYFLEDGSFIRINNMTVGYTFDAPKVWKNLSALRCYLSAQNPFIFTKYTGFTPELPGNQNEAGIELNVYPISSTFLLGLNAQF